MTAFGRRHLGSVGLAFVMASMALPIGTVGANAAAGQLSMTAHFGYSNSLKLGEWMPLTVDITNSGPNVDGTLEIDTTSNFPTKGALPGGNATYRLPMSLAPGATKHFHTYVIQGQPGAIRVRAVERGRVLTSQQVNTTNTFGVLLGIISDQPSMLSTLASVQPGGLSPGVVHLSPSDIPDSGIVLRAFDLLAIDDFATDTLTSGQRQAIVDYVMNGGALLLGTGGTWHKTLGGLPPAVVPMQITGSTTLGPASALGGLSGVEIATGTLNGGSAWLSEGKDPLLVEQQDGRGIVALATFDWNQDSIAGWSGSASLLRQIFVRSTFGVGATPGGTTFVGPFGVSTSMAGSAVSQVLSNLPALNLPAWWFIGALVFAYVLLVGPANYLLLRRLNRRALAWVTVPTIAIVASAGAYGTSVVTKGRSVQANQVALVHTAQDWGRAYEESYTGILTPARGDYHVVLDGGVPLISPLIDYSGGPTTADSTAIQVDAATGAITLPGMTAFTLRGFAAEGMTNAGGLVGSARLIGGKLVGAVKNTSSLRLTDGVVLFGNSYQTFGALAPGAETTFSFTPVAGNPFNGMPAFQAIYPNNLYGQQGPVNNGGNSDSERLAEAKSAVISTLPVNGMQGSIGLSWPIVVGWNEQPLRDVTVDGSHPRFYALTALITALPLVGIGAGSLPAGIVAGRPVDIDGQVQPQGGPPGYLFVQGGSVTYDFAPKLTSGTSLFNVAISSSNAGGAKFVGPSGAASSTSAEVWDWSSSAWVKCDYVDGRSTQVPDSAVNPATGEVRLKLSSDGTSTTGWLSLTGEVQ